MCGLGQPLHLGEAFRQMQMHTPSFKEKSQTTWGETRVGCCISTSSRSPSLQRDHIKAVVIQAVKEKKRTAAAKKKGHLLSVN
jgi:hypothetical protein